MNTITLLSSTGLIIGIIGAVIVVLVLILLIWYVSTFNNFSRTKVKVSESESGIDVALTKRYDVLTKSMDVVKAYAKHEILTFEKVIALRKGMTIAEKAEANKSMDELKRSINVVAESYPQLHSNQNYSKLQTAIADVEEHLQAARRAYNSNVSHFNQMTATFPSRIVAGIHGFKPFEFFVADENKRKDLNIDLDYNK